MVTRYGMSDKLGPMVYGENEGEVFLGRSVTTHKNLSEATMQQVDQEIRRILDEQYALAVKLLDENRDKVEAMTAALIEWETIDREQIRDIMENRFAAPAEAGWWFCPAGNQTAGTACAGSQHHTGPGTVSAIAHPRAAA